MDLSSSSFVANNVESPGEITKNGTDAGLKDIYRYGGGLSITGTQGIHDLSFKAYLSSEKSNNFTVRNSKGEVIDNPFLSRITGYNWKGIQLRDQIHLGRHSITAGYDYNYAYGKLKVYSAPVGQQANEYTTSPNSSLVSNGIYVQGNLNFLDNKLILNPGARMDFTTFSILDTPGFINELQTGSKTTRFLARVSVASTASLTVLPYMVVWAGLLLHQMLLILPVLPLLVKVQVRSPSIREILILRTKTAGLRILVSNITAMSYWRISLTSGQMSKTVSLPELFRRKRLW